MSSSLLLTALLFLAGCASSPYFEAGTAWQYDRGSDWVMQPERDWTPSESEPKINMAAGLEWAGNVDCYVQVQYGPWEQMFVGCAKSFGAEGSKLSLFIQPAIVHQVDSRTTEFLRTDQKQWQGHNPFVHVRVGLRWKGIRCPVIATGKSLFQGAPFESEEHAPDLYWTNIECGVRFGGKTGAFR